MAKFAIGFGMAYILHGSLLGLTDDEAYYWVLAQSPGWGFAYHPPAVAWFIALPQFLLGWALGKSEFLVRLPAALVMSGVVYLSLVWAHWQRVKKTGHFFWLLISFAGLFFGTWMIVPDVPLFLGWMLAFVSAWALCFGPTRMAQRALWGIGVGSFVALSGKFSGGLVGVSAALCAWFWAPRSLRVRGGLVALGGITAGLIPIVIWNMQNDWGSILYQIKDRHGGHDFSLWRWLKFLAAECLLLGPPAFWFVLRVGQRWKKERLTRFVLVWAVPPALVFLFQPLWSAFKLHWAFVIWLPMLMEMAVRYGKGQVRRLGNWQIGYGLAVGAFVWVSCHFPLIPALHAGFSSRPFDARWDVTNDMYGWNQLGNFILSREGVGAKKRPVVGSRYQTASHAAFSLGPEWKVTLVPRSKKELKEWPNYRFSTGQGPAWPELTREIYYVADNRYTQGPLFPNARCSKLGRMETKRYSYPAKWVAVWKCRPN